MEITWEGSELCEYLAPSELEGVAYLYSACPENWKARPDTIWLPRQDQLQEMVGQPYSRPSKQLRELAEFSDEGHPSASFEQLWLAFVMKEKYGKTWKGEWK